MKLLIEAPPEQTIEANTLKVILEARLKELPSPFSDITVIVTQPYVVTPSPDWKEIETNLYVRRDGEKDAS